ncbi:MAG: GGDEF domain-containing protein [Myxococcaceae bacterium]|nr:GGDEF domain-containing protein [Myxococcaceae bacterium]
MLDALVPLHVPAGSPLAVFSPQELDALSASGTPRRCAAGEAIVVENEPGDSMFMLLDGTAEARLPDGRAVRQYTPGAYFGELSFINPGHRRSASIVATSPAQLCVLDQRSIESLTEHHPKVIFTLLRRACAFLVDAERNLVSDLRRRNAELQDTLARLDFTRRRLTQEEERARTDTLSGLFNRRAFDAELPSFMERAAAIGAGLAVLALDLDHFKPVNDTLGHAAGDEVLRGAGKLLKQHTRPTDLPCRIGGDEFIVLLSDLDEANARKKAESLRAAIGAMPHPGNDQGIRITTTMGGTMFRPGETAADFLHRADEALYAAKRAGRNRVAWG